MVIFYTVKQNFDLEEYSLSQSTLGQVGQFQRLWFTKIKCMVFEFSVIRSNMILAPPPFLPFPLLPSLPRVFLELSKEQELDPFE